MESFQEILCNLGYKLNDRGTEWRCRPIYRESNNASSLRIVKKTGSWCDFSANLRGNFEDLVKLSLNLTSVEDAKKWLKNQNFQHISKEIEQPKVKATKFYDDAILNKLIPDYTYWNKRGISNETLKLLGSSGVAHSGKMYRRYVFAIRDRQNKIIGFSGRVILDKYVTDTNPKWKHIGPKNEFIYPWNIAENCIREKREVLLVESIGDILSLNEVGICNSMCLFGVSISGKLISYLTALNPNRIIIATNNDGNENGNVGQNRAQDIQKKICKFFDCSKVSIAHPTLNDFNEMLMKGDNIPDWYSKI